MSTIQFVYFLLKSKTSCSILYIVSNSFEVLNMENLIFSFNVLLPLIIEIGLGFLLKTTGIVDSHTSKAVNKMVFKLFLPVLLFNNLYTAELSDAFNMSLMTFAVVAVFVTVALLCVLVPLFEKDKTKRGSAIQGMFRSNFAIFGVPLSISIAGEAIRSTVSVAVAVVVFVFNILAVVVLEAYNGKNPDFKSILKSIVTNPLIISCTLGVIVLLMGVRLPAPINKTIDGISKVATPLGLIILGTSISLPSVKENAKRLIWILGGKLVIIPSVILAIAISMGFKGGELAILLAVFASPTAISSYPMAVEMGHDGELAAQIVMFGTVVCIVTMFFFVFALKQIGVL